jgi:multiple sugar transport system substrate-binding protein
MLGKKRKFFGFLMIFFLMMIVISSPLFGQQKELTFLVRSHFVPAFNPELKRQIDEWNKKYPDVKVRIDFASYKEMPIKYASESEAKKGHDIIAFEYMSPLIYSESLLHVDDIVEDLGNKYGGWMPITKHFAWFDGHWRAVPWYMCNGLINYRTDYFGEIGESREKVHNYTWEDLLSASEKLKKSGHPGGFEINLDPDANDALYPILWSFGGTTVNSKGEIMIKSPETAQAIEFVKRLFPQMPREVLGWDSASNNRFMLSGLGSWTINTPSIWIVALKDFPEIGGKIDHAPVPSGPKGRYRFVNSFSLGIWKFGSNIELSKDLVRFLLEEKQFRRQITESTGYNQPLLKDYKKHPIWAQTTPLNSYEPGKETLGLPGFQGPPDPRASKVYHNWVIPNMFAKAVTGTPTDEAMEWAENEIKRLYEE